MTTHKPQDLIAQCTVSKSYWLQAFTMLPFMGLVMGAMLIGLLSELGLNFSQPILWGMLISVPLGLMVVAIGFDYFYTYWALTEQALILRRGFAQEVVPFNEIKSIYFGLPEALPWYVRINRYNPKGYSAYKATVTARENAFLLKLSNQRMLPLALSTAASYQGGVHLMLMLNLLNEEKMVENHSYTAEESAFLSTCGYNKIVTMPPSFML